MTRADLNGTRRERGLLEEGHASEQQGQWEEACWEAGVGVHGGKMAQNQIC